MTETKVNTAEDIDSSNQEKIIKSRVKRTRSECIDIKRIVDKKREENALKGFIVEVEVGKISHKISRKI
jgi:hypothetical protein